MFNITLIVTVHRELGKCNSDELYKIIETIEPQVIFEEMPKVLFDRSYNGNHPSDESLEVKCIRKYLLTHNIQHLPVDIDVNPNLSTSNIDYMFDTFNKYPIYQKLENEQDLLTAEEGFVYLNSNKCSELFEKKMITEKNLMELEINKIGLYHIYNLFHEEHDKRENAMLKNIYNYSKTNQYNKAVFFIGSAHRKSIIRKISECEGRENIKLNWTFYNDEDL